MNTLILGRNIHKARRDRGLSSDKLSEMCDITPAYLRQVEAGNKTPSLPLFVTLCEKLQVSSSVLLSGVLEVEDTSVEDLKELCASATPSQLKLIKEMIKTALDNC